MDSIISILLQQSALLIVCVYALGQLDRRQKRFRKRTLILLFAAMNLIAQFFAFKIQDGIYIDLRTPINMIAAYCGGPIVGWAVWLFSASIRLVAGGQGVIAGIVALMLGTLIGLILGQHQRKVNKNNPMVAWLIMALAVDVCSLSSVLLLPGGQATWSLVYQTVGLQVSLLYPSSVIFFGLLYEREKQFTSAMQEREEEHHRLVNMANSLPVGIFRIDASDLSRQSFVNQKALDFAGLRPDQLEQEHWANALHPEDREWVLKEWARCAEQGEIFQGRYRFVKPDGSISHMLGQVIPESNSKGEFVGYLGTLTDISLENINEQLEDIVQERTQELHKAHRDLMDSEMKYKELIESTDNLITQVDSIGTFMYLNHSAETVFGLPPQKLIGQNALAYIHPDDRDKTQQWLQLAAAQQVKSSTIENRQRHANGSYRHMIWTCNFHYDPKGGLSHINSIAQDITERVELEDQLRQAEKLKVVGHLAGGIAHDFNNQLAGIMGFAEVIALQTEDPKILEYVEYIRKTSLKSADLTSKLLAFGRKGNVIQTTVDIHELISEVHTILLHSIDKKIHIHIELHAQNKEVKGDPSQLQNAILNLCLNAKDAMADGGTLLIQTQDHSDERSTQDQLLIKVKDTGGGISEDIMGQIFEPFFTTKAIGAGTGMGLASVEGTVKSHHGRIEVDSQVQKGTCFSIFLPVESQKSSSKTKQDASSSMESAEKNGHILLVDDEETLRELGSNILSGEGYRVSTCQNGKEAFELYQREHANIDLVILDMIMPVMDGQQTFKLMKEINPDIKVILSSGYSLEGEAQTTLDTGAQAFLAKPYSIKALSETVDRVLQAPHSNSPLT